MRRPWTSGAHRATRGRRRRPQPAQPVQAAHPNASRTSGTNDIAYSVVVRKDGKIIVGGDANDGADFALTKNDAKGIEHSQKILDLGGSDEEIRALATDGKNATYAAGWTNAGGNYDIRARDVDEGPSMPRSSRSSSNGIARTDL